MASLVIVSGCPGSGKTTVAAALEQSLPSGLHLESDAFYDFPARLIEPTRPESQQQNETIMRALGRATVEAFLDLGSFESHVVETLQSSAPEVLAQVEAGLEAGRFRLGPGSEGAG